MRGFYNVNRGGYFNTVSAHERIKLAEENLKKLQKKGNKPEPIAAFSGRGDIKCTTTIGQTWCDHLLNELHCKNDERYGRGRRYLRNGSVIDLKIHDDGNVEGKVQGSSLYKVKIKVDPLSNHTWLETVKKLGVNFEDMIGIVEGNIPTHLTASLMEQGSVFLPPQNEFHMSCSCPDYSSRCKHIYAIMFGIGRKLDENPSLIFSLRQIDKTELIKIASEKLYEASSKNSEHAVSDDSLADVFGIDIQSPTSSDNKSAKKHSSQTNKLNEDININASQGKTLSKEKNSPKKALKTKEQTKVNATNKKQSKSTDTSSRKSTQKIQSPGNVKGKIKKSPLKTKAGDKNKITKPKTKTTAKSKSTIKSQKIVKTSKKSLKPALSKKTTKTALQTKTKSKVAAKSKTRSSTNTKTKKR